MVNINLSSSEVNEMKSKNFLSSNPHFHKFLVLFPRSNHWQVSFISEEILYGKQVGPPRTAPFL